MVIRPIDIGRVGRTVLTPYRNNPSEAYPLCTSEFEGHLLGKQLKVIGAPFVQPDSMIMCCAHASIWMAARYMHKEFGFAECLPYEISEHASRYFTILPRVLPTEGLTSTEISNAFTNMGYSPMMHSKPKQVSFETDKEYKDKLKEWDPMRWIYRYVESKIPVIALFPDHATTIIGHTFSYGLSERPKRQVPTLFNIVYSHDWVDGYIMHDPAIGPYQILPISAKDQGKHIAERYGSLLPLVSKDHTLDDIEEFVVPLPEKVYILAEHIDDIVKGILQEGPHAKILYRNVLEMAKKGNQASIDFLTSLLNIRRKNNPVILRVFFIPSVVYKEHLAKQDTEHPMHPRVIEEYQKLHMSRFVWIIQVTNMQNYCKEKQEDRQIFGEILIDATANKLGLSYLAIHLPGVLFIRRLEDDYLAKPIFIPDDHPYCIQIR